MPPDTRPAVLERAGGNPLFAREFVRMVGEGGVAVSDAGVPDSVQAVVAARLDLLPDDQRALLQAAAVVGGTFWPDALATIEGSEPGIVLDGVREMAARGLVRDVPATFENEPEFAFTHAVIRDVAYARLPRL